MLTSDNGVLGHTSPLPFSTQISIFSITISPDVLGPLTTFRPLDFQIICIIKGFTKIAPRISPSAFLTMQCKDGFVIMWISFIFLVQIQVAFFIVTDGQIAFANLDLYCGCEVGRVTGTTSKLGQASVLQRNFVISL